MQTNRRNCGQIAVAVIAGKDPKEVAEVIGKKTGTTVKHLIQALRHFGFMCDDKLRTGGFYCGNGSIHIARLASNKGSGHWVVIADGQVYDGLRSGPMPIADYERYVKKAYGWHIKSHLLVLGRGPAPTEEGICQKCQGWKPDHCICNSTPSKYMRDRTEREDHGGSNCNH